MTRKNLTYSILILLQLITVDIAVFSQEIAMKNYVVITYERIQSKSLHGKEDFYWILETDSIKQNNLMAFPLFLDRYSKDQLDHCLKKDKIDVFKMTPTSDFTFDKKYEAQIEHLRSIIKTQRIKLQTITLKWSKGIITSINVFATPVSGYLCKCVQEHKTGNVVNYKGLTFLPVMEFEYDKNFEQTKNADILRFSNFSTIDFSSYTSLSQLGIQSDYKVAY